MIKKNFKKFNDNKELLLKIAKLKFNQQQKNISANQFFIFLKKFRGSLIFRGNSSLSYKYFDFVRIFFKNNLYYGDSVKAALKIAFLNLIPFVGMSNLKIGRKVQTVPVLLKDNRKFVFVNKWLISSQKNKIGVKPRGIDIKLIARDLFLAMTKRGMAYSKKMEYIDRALDTRYLLMQRKRKKNWFALKSFKNFIKKKLKSKVLKKKEYFLNNELDFEKKKNNAIYVKKKDIKTFVKVFRFVFFKYRNKKIKFLRDSLMQTMLRNIDNKPLVKINALWNWYLKFHKDYNLKLNVKLLKFIKKKYFTKWKKKKKT